VLCGCILIDCQFVCNVSNCRFLADFCITISSQQPKIRGRGTCRDTTAQISGSLFLNLVNQGHRRIQELKLGGGKVDLARAESRRQRHQGGGCGRGCLPPHIGRSGEGALRITYSESTAGSFGSYIPLNRSSSTDHWTAVSRIQ